MDAKHIADLIAQVADLAREGVITLEMNGNLNAALWELAARKDIREEVHAILQASTEDELENLDA